MALASRPGRIDQAIEFPLPDETGRRKLVALYSPGVTLSSSVVDETVRRTEGVSPAVIKELMRRTVRFHIDGAVFIIGMVLAAIIWAISHWCGRPP